MTYRSKISINRASVSAAVHEDLGHVGFTLLIVDGGIRLTIHRVGAYSMISFRVLLITSCSMLTREKLCASISIIVLRRKCRVLLTFRDNMVICRVTELHCSILPSDFTPVLARS